MISPDWKDTMDKILGGGELKVQDVQGFGLWTDLG